MRSLLISLFCIAAIFVGNAANTIKWTGSGQANNLFDKNNWVDITTNSAPLSIASGIPVNGNITIEAGFNIGVDREIKGVLNAGTGNISIKKSKVRTDYGTVSKIIASDSIVLDSATLLTGYASASKIILKGKSELHLFEAKNPIPSGTIIDLQNADAWVFFLSISPSNIGKYLTQITVNGAPLKMDDNARVCQYYGGTVVIPHPKTYTALSVYSDENQTGTVKNFAGDGVKKYGTYAIGTAKSIKLKRGYMAILTNNPSGTGKSKVYVADDADLTVTNQLNGTDNSVMYLRVLPWQWVSKKGVGWGASIDLFNSSWYYNWSSSPNGAGSLTDNTQEYVAMRHGKSWPDLSGLATKPKVTHTLGFNEPERTDQANMTVAEALSMWSMLEGTGTILGSPVPANTTAGKNWLIAFMDSCIRRGYRVDHICVHNYEKYDPNYFVNTWCKFWYDKYKLPVWVTEFNYGEGWNSSTSVGQLNEYHTGFKGYVEALDKASFIERYAFYTSKVITNDVNALYAGFESSNPTYLSRRGIYYREFESRPSRGNPILYKKQIMDAKLAEEALNVSTDYDGKCYSLLSRNTDGTSKRRVEISTVAAKADSAFMGGNMAAATAIQSFSFKKVETGKYKLIAHNCKALAVVDGKVCVQANTGDDTQLWEIIPIEGTVYVVLKNVATQKYLHPLGGKINIGTALTTDFTDAEIVSKTKAHWEMQTSNLCSCFDADDSNITVAPRSGYAPHKVKFSAPAKSAAGKEMYYLWYIKRSANDSVYTTNYADSITFTQPGNYKLNVRVRDYYGIDKTVEYSIEVLEATSVKGLKAENEFLLYPNPAQNSVRFNGVKNNEQVSVYNLQSQLITQKSLIDNELNISDLKNGMYLVSIKGYKTIKLLKQ